MGCCVIPHEPKASVGIDYTSPMAGPKRTDARSRQSLRDCGMTYASAAPYDASSRSTGWMARAVMPA
jgi:hypothetical protein